MNWRLITALVIVGVVVILIVYDLVVYVTKGNNATISRVILDTARARPGFMLLFAFAFGVLFGHLFLPQTP